MRIALSKECDPHEREGERERERERALEPWRGEIEINYLIVLIIVRYYI